MKTKCHFRFSHSGPATSSTGFTRRRPLGLSRGPKGLGGILTKHIRYDNLASTVNAVVFGQGRQRQGNGR